MFSDEDLDVEKVILYNWFTKRWLKSNNTSMSREAARWVLDL
jgi:hypothetical protein